jgi:tripartite-type tricarboxylate transporter receptor subunit TctC
MRVLTLTFAAAVLSSPATSGSPAGAAEYPAKPVKVVVPFPPGGGVDVIARTVAQKLSARIGGQFYVENLPGAGGDIGTVAVANAAPDGHTVLFVAPDFVTSPLVKAKVAYDPLKNFAPVSLVATAQEAITIHPSVAARNVGELLTLIKSSPNRYTVAIPGYGTLGHLEGLRLFELSHGLQVTYVPFQGLAPALTSTVGGHTTILIGPIALVAPNLKDGHLRALAVEGAKRSPLLAGVPTLAEAGIINHESEFATGLLVPAGTPADIVRLLQAQIAQITALPDVKERLGTLGFDPIGSTSDEFAAWIKAETAKWAPIVRAANVKIN